MSTTMDYGRADAPREAPIPEHLTLAQHAGIIVIVFALIWALGALLLIARGPAVQRLNFPVDATTSPTPSASPRVG